MALTAVDRSILHKCLQHETGSWNDFVDRFLGLIYHVIHYTAHLRSNPITPELVEDIAEAVLIQIAANDYSLLRQFRGKSSLSSFLTVIARRICVAELVHRFGGTRKPLPSEFQLPSGEIEKQPRDQEPIGSEQLETIRKLLKKLPSREREIVRLFYLEARTYEDISIELNVPVKTIGPILGRVRKILHQYESGKKKEPSNKKNISE